MDALVVAVDFDHTLHNPDDREPGYRMGKPYQGAKDAMESLKALGARLVIHTCRARAPQGVPDPDPQLAHYTGSAAHVEDWLRHFEIPFDEVTAVKPMAAAYIDDKAVPFTGDWPLALLEVRAMLYAEKNL